MARGEQALLNRFYPIEMHGDTLVLKPRGDAAGFSLHSVITELDHVRGLFEAGRARNLLIDLGHYRYFGSMVIGDLIDLAQMVRERGGRAGLCGASDDMASVMRLMQLDDQWEQFPTTSDGLHALARIPVAERVWRFRYPIASAAAAVIILAVYLFAPRPNYGVVYHDQVHRLWKEVSAKRTNSGIEDWRWTAKKTEAQLEPIIHRLERRLDSHRATQSEKYMLLALKFHWVPWLYESGFDAERDAVLTQYFLDMTTAANSGSPPPAEPAFLRNLAKATPQVELVSDGTGEFSTPPANVPTELSILPVSGAGDTVPVINAPENDGTQSTDAAPI